MRFFELANQAGIEKKDHQQALEYVKKQGFDIKNTLSSIDDNPAIGDWVHANAAAIIAYVNSAQAKIDAEAKKRPLTGAVAKNKKKAAPAAKAKSAAPEKPAPAAAAKPAAPAPVPTAPAAKVVAKPAPSPTVPTPKPVKRPTPVPPKKKAEQRRISFPMPAPIRVDVPEQNGGLVIESAKSNGGVSDVNSGSQKHKRADFKILTRPELPAIFASGESEYTRSIRSSGPAKRPQGRGQQFQGGKGKRFKGKGHHGSAAPQPRDPNAKAELEPTMSLRNLSEALGVKLNDIMGF
ncbi:MAG: hypothetical protein J6333_06760, partial [Planctomycetes bacterium]|nr:hypothetical protein [Planctomycetota bacterium]